MIKCLRQKFETETLEVISFHYISRGFVLIFLNRCDLFIPILQAKRTHILNWHRRNSIIESIIKKILETITFHPFWHSSSNSYAPMHFCQTEIGKFCKVYRKRIMFFFLSSLFRIRIENKIVQNFFYLHEKNNN